jgi:hypothetical protein
VSGSTRSSIVSGERGERRSAGSGSDGERERAEALNRAPPPELERVRSLNVPARERAEAVNGPVTAARWPRAPRGRGPRPHSILVNELSDVHPAGLPAPPRSLSVNSPKNPALERGVDAHMPPPIVSWKGPGSRAPGQKAGKIIYQ